ncbi:MAG: hypothetical protein ACC645_14930 [Pirellulales bacterium]
MRTTVTLDDDVEQLLREAMRQTGQNFKQTLNQAIRKGMVGTVLPAEEQPFEVRARRMKLRVGIDPTHLNRLNDELEVDAFLEVARTLRDRERVTSPPTESMLPED